MEYIENYTVTFYTDSDNRVYFYQNEDNTYKEYTIEYELPEIPDMELNDGYYIYDGEEFTFGYELNINKVYSKILAYKSELKSMDYLTSKEIDGEDMTQYGDYKSYRKSIRSKINELSLLINNE